VFLLERFTHFGKQEGLHAVMFLLVYACLAAYLDAGLRPPVPIGEYTFRAVRSLARGAVSVLVRRPC
jgi:hypothetical protein